MHTITRFLGLDGVGAADVLAWYQSISKAITDLTTGQGVDQGTEDAVAEIQRRVRSTVESATSATLLADIEASGTLRADEMGSAVAVLMVGAIETAEGMTANALWQLLTTPGAWCAVKADRSMVANAIEESLRCEPAAAVIDRYTTGDVDLGGVAIPAGEPVTISLLAANHDPAALAGLLDLPVEPLLDRARSVGPSGLNFRKPEAFWVTWTRPAGRPC